MRNYTVDIGNTRFKTAVFEGEELLEEKSFESSEDWIAYSRSLSFEQCIISSVTYQEAELRDLLGFDFCYLSKELKMPFTNLYATPHTLGVDRKAAMVGARALFREGPLLAVDLGSCITFDLLDNDNVYRGGSISPGMRMRFRAMHGLTARLPLENLEIGEVPSLIGKSTSLGLKSGVYHGILFEIEGYIRAYQRQYQDLKVIICGGDSKIFESLTKDHIFVIPNLVLYGLNRILIYNVNFE